MDAFLWFWISLMAMFAWYAVMMLLILLKLHSIERLLSIRETRSFRPVPGDTRGLVQMDQVRVNYPRGRSAAEALSDAAQAATILGREIQPRRQP